MGNRDQTGWNSRDRFMAALVGEKPDRTPVAHVSAMATAESQAATGCFMPNTHTDPQQLAKLSAANHDLLGFDAVSFIINFFNEPAALGCVIDWGNERQLPMFLSHPWSNAEDAIAPGDFLDRHPISTCLRMLGIAKRDYGDRMAVLGKIMGPLSMIQVMHGVENVMIGMIDEPEHIHHFLDVAADILIQFAIAQFEQGIDAISIGEGGAGANMLSPEMHEEFLLSVHQRMIKAIPGSVVMHICGDITPRLGLLSQTQLSCFNFDWSIDPKIMKARSGDSFRVMGNVNTSDLLSSTPEVIEGQVFKCLEAGVDIISPGCAVSPSCPNENLKMISDAVKKWYMDA